MPFRWLILSNAVAIFWAKAGNQKGPRKTIDLQSAPSHFLAANFLSFPFEGFSRRVLSAATEHVVFWTFQNLNCKTSQNPSIFIQLYWKWQIVHSHVWLKRLTRWCLVADQLPSVQANGPWQITEHTEHQWLNGHRIIKWIHFSAPEPRRGLDLFLFENSDTVLPIGWFYVSSHLCPEPEKIHQRNAKGKKSKRVQPQK